MVFIVYFSCTSKTQNEQIKDLSNAEVIKVDFGKEYRDRKFPNTNYSMTIQQLEDHEEHPVGHIDKLIVDKNKIYILDKNKARSLFIYNRNGRLLNVINRTGLGPGEYTHLDDFDVDKETENIIVMDANQRKLIFYTSDGAYINEIKYDFLALNFIMENKNEILMDKSTILSKDDFYCLKRIDFDGKVLNSSFSPDFSVAAMTFNPRASLQRCNNKIFYLPTMSNCIYVLDGISSGLAYSVDFGKNWPSKDFCSQMKNTHPLKIRKIMFENKYVCFLNYIQTKDVLHLDFYKEKNYSFYYNKDTKKTLLISMEDNSFSFPLATYENEFVSVKYKEDTGVPILIFYTVNFDLE
jgi:hypothetical protein